MGRDRADGAIDLFDRTDQQTSKAVEAKKSFIDTIRTTLHEACELPAQEDPSIDQDQADAE